MSGGMLRKIVSRCRSRVFLLLAPLAALAVIVGVAIPAQASVTVWHDTGQVTIKVGGVTEITTGFDVASLKYPSGSNQAYKPRSLRIHNTYNASGQLDSVVCNAWYGNDNASTRGTALSLNEDQWAGWNPPGCDAWFAVGSGGQATSYLFTSNDDGTNQSCTLAEWECDIAGGVPAASAGPGGAVNNHPDINFGFEYYGGVIYQCYVGIRIAVGNGANQNTTYNC